MSHQPYFHCLCIFLFCFLAACSTEEDDNGRIAQLEEEKAELEEIIRLSNEYLESFSTEFDALYLNLDSVEAMRDSLLNLSAQDQPFNSDTLAILEASLERGQEEIERLRQRLNNSAQSDAVVGTLRRQLDLAEASVTKLKLDNKALRAENDSITLALNYTRSELAESEDRADEANLTLEQERLAYEKAAAEQRSRLATERAEKERIRRESADKVSQAEQLYDEAKFKLEMADTFIQITRKGKVKIKPRDRERVKALLAECVDALETSKQLGFAGANELLNTIYGEAKYQSVRPLQ